MEFERKELIKIRQRADRCAGDFQISTVWKRAYEALSDAANLLDAMFARREEELKKMDCSPEKENKEKE